MDDTQSISHYGASKKVSIPGKFDYSVVCQIVNNFTVASVQYEAFLLEKRSKFCRK